MLKKLFFITITLLIKDVSAFHESDTQLRKIDNDLLSLRWLTFMDRRADYRGSFDQENPKVINEKTLAITLTIQPSDLEWGKNMFQNKNDRIFYSLFSSHSETGGEKGAFCLQLWDHRYKKGEFIGLYNKKMTGWHYEYNWRQMHMTGNGHFGNWRVHSRKATMDDLKDPKKACSQMLSYL